MNDNNAPGICAFARNFGFPELPDHYAFVQVFNVFQDF